MRVISPVYGRPSGWNRLLAPRVVVTAGLSGIRKARFAVIGAGYAGIAVSRRLAELFPDERIVLLESSTVGEGAAGRNSGFLIDQPYAKIQASKDAKEAEWQKLFLQTGRKWLEELVGRHGIDCGWNPCGNYKAAMTEQGEAELKELAGRLKSVGASFEALSRADLADRLGTSFYRAAVWMPNCILVQPAALVRGLADNLPQNVILAEETPVLDVRRGKPHTVVTPQGEVEADMVIFANNSFLGRFGIARSRQITMYTYAGLTPALPAEDADRLGAASDWGMVPAERMGATTRKVGDRYMIRTGFSYERELDNAEVEAALRNAYRKRYPDMPSHELEYVWGGAVSITRNGAPFFGEVGPGLYGVSGCNGSGIIKMSLLGKLLAEHIAGQDSTLLRGCLEWAKPSWIPPEPLRRIGVAMSMRKHIRLVAQARP
ncbi:FAD-binding oxidoreductase [Mesorhizobium sp. SP-1A]|uniref:NAD(P)/FAD-dependent oxidoreductase n=1 Tax=Mesorhizobium sp. SP-1A TaxID=3077840 RepID=UPI0028F6F795|nr:FAD-binding oxidoreductase [Mesorhizobium sp. SP-1A]